MNESNNNLIQKQALNTNEGFYISDDQLKELYEVDLEGSRVDEQCLNDFENNEIEINEMRLLKTEDNVMADTMLTASCNLPTQETADTLMMNTSNPDQNLINQKQPPNINRNYTSVSNIDIKQLHEEVILGKDEHDLFFENGINNDGNSYDCTIYTKKLYSAAQLKSHMAIHEKSFKCNLCEFSTAYKYDLKRHMLSHTNEKPFECNVCNKRYTLKPWLEYHIKSHNLLTEKATLAKTVDKDEDKERFKCHICDNNFEDNYSLTCHIKNRHYLLIEISENQSRTSYINCEQDFVKFDHYQDGSPGQKFIKEPTLLELNLTSVPDVAVNKDLETCSQDSIQINAKYLDLVNVSNREETVNLKEELIHNLRKEISKNENQNSYACSFCNKQFDTFNQFKIHKLIHEKHYKCTQCNYSSERNKKLKYHYWNMHTISKQFVTSVQLTSSMLSHETMYKCIQCSYSAKMKKQVKYHYWTKHINEEPNSNTEESEIVEGNLSNTENSLSESLTINEMKLVKIENDVKAHNGLFDYIDVSSSQINAKELNETGIYQIDSKSQFKELYEEMIFEEPKIIDGSFQETVTSIETNVVNTMGLVKIEGGSDTDKGFNITCSSFNQQTADTLMVNMNEHNEKLVTNQNLEFCATNDHINEVILDKQDSDNLSKEMFKDENSNTYDCAICSKGFVSAFQLKCHLTNHEKPFKCSLCEWGCFHKQYLRRHILSHTVEKQFECNICRKRFTTKVSLNYHLKSHTRERPFKCKYCDYSSKIIRHLNYHCWSKHNKPNDVLENQETNSYCCSICGKACVTGAHLKRHMVSHKKSFKCNLCESTFSFKSNLKHHLLSHTGEKLFECDICYNRYTVKESLENHRKLHTAEKPIKCTHCNYISETKTDLLDHCWSKHSSRNKISKNQETKSYCCSVCGEACVTDTQLKLHMVNHRKLFKCSLCDSMFSVKGNLKRHMRSHTGEKLFECYLCNNRFTTKDALKYHLKSHTGERPFKCKYCNYSSKTNKMLKYHCWSKHNKSNDVLENQETNSYCCSICEKACVSDLHLRRHMTIHKKVFKCNLCESAFSLKANLKRHMISHTGEKQFECDICYNRYTAKESLKNHRNLHIGEKCTRCNYTSRSKTDLMYHYWSKHNSSNEISENQGTKSYCCSVCGKACFTGARLKCHMENHKNSFKCSLCDSTFSLKSNLNRHMRSHTGEKLFECYVCHKRYTTKVSLNYHIKSHTGKRPFKCTYCSYETKTSKQLKYHYKRQHKLLNDNVVWIKIEKNYRNDDEKQ